MRLQERLQKWAEHLIFIVLLLLFPLNALAQYVRVQNENLGVVCYQIRCSGFLSSRFAVAFRSR